MKRLGGRLLLATHNAGKLEEMRALFAPRGVEMTSAGALGLPQPDETEDSFLGNARIKAQAAVAATGLPTLADDSGLCVDALGGQPGVHTADWAETPQGRDFTAAMTRVWDALQDAGAEEPRRAQFRATLLLLLPDGTELVAEGITPGRIVWPPRGADGHGYDPIFLPDGEGRTFGEMTLAEKNRLSHRARAFAALEAQLVR